MRYETISLSDPRFLYRGRTVLSEDGVLSLPWSLSGFSFRFVGSGVILNQAPTKQDEPAYLRVWMDGNARRVGVKDGSEKILLETGINGDEDSLHEVTVLRVTEGMEPLRISSVSLSGTAPSLEARPAKASLKLAFIGDSITCGYGVLGPKEEPGFHTFEEDATRSYAYRTAERLGADISLAGASGKGIVANCLGDRADMTLRQAFHWADRQGNPYVFPAEDTPDIVIVNAGTNDSWGGVQDAEFTDTAVLFLSEIRAVYPDAPIVYCYGVMDEFKQDAVRAAVERFSANHKNVFHFPVASMNAFPDEVGGGGHPNTNTSERVSALLADFLRTNVLPLLKGNK
ncbi:MAG: hypothetical protein J5843_03325 [Clostridia bacterium]|nr:hypothetical protein [Clostridia bacterium]